MKHSKVSYALGYSHTNGYATLLQPGKDSATSTTTQDKYKRKHFGMKLYPSQPIFRSVSSKAGKNQRRMSALIAL